MKSKLSDRPDDPEQSKRFIETAKEIGTDESPEAFERAFGRVARRVTPEASGTAPQKKT